MKVKLDGTHPMKQDSGVRHATTAVHRLSPSGFTSAVWSPLMLRGRRPATHSHRAANALLATMRRTGHSINDERSDLE